MDTSTFGPIGKYLNKKQLIILFGFILTIAASLRLINFGGFNKIRADEESWITNGYFLLNEGVPKTWTAFWDTYDDYHHEYFGDKGYLVVEPYLDHPPLFSLLIGSWADLTTQPTKLLSNWEITRLPMLCIALLSIVVTTLLAKELFSLDQAFFTFIAFSFLPSHIVTGKIVAAENLLGLLLVTSLLIATYLIKSPQTKHARLYTFILALLSASAILIKLSGIIIPFIVGILLFYYQKNKALITIVAAAALASILFFFYGWYYDLDLFYSVLAAHGQREQTFWYFFTIFAQPDLGYFRVKDPLMIMGIIGNLAITLENFKTSPKSINPKILLSITWLSLSFLFACLAPVELYAWYKYLLYPLVAIGLGWIWHQFYRGESSWLILLIPSLLLLMENIFLTSPSYNLQRKFFTIILFGLAIIFSLFRDNKTKKHYYPSFALSLIFLIIFFAGWWGALLNQI